MTMSWWLLYCKSWDSWVGQRDLQMVPFYKQTQNVSVKRHQGSMKKLIMCCHTRLRASLLGPQYAYRHIQDTHTNLFAIFDQPNTLIGKRNVLWRLVEKLVVLSATRQKIFFCARTRRNRCWQFYQWKWINIHIYERQKQEKAIFG